MRGLILALVATLAIGVAAAEPAKTEAKQPTDFRRTTLIVRDIDKSLALYRDALGMTVYYDQQLTSPRLERKGSDGVNRSRLVLLKANDGFVGLLGLWQFLDGPAPPPPPAKPDFAPNEIVLLFNAEDLETRFEKVRATPGVKIMSEPTLRVYPGANGTEIRVMVSMLTDADGHIVELNKALSALPSMK
jgi:catechol 2,3-dioxygenase-like lactoylglutathione lyase family enzyme